MLKLTTGLVLLFRTLIYDSKDEYSFQSPRFDTRKLLTFIIAVLLSYLSVNLVAKIFIIAEKNVQLTKELSTCHSKK
jgi:hypothetical protein